MGVIMLIQLVLNIAGVQLVSFLNQVSVWWHIVIVAPSSSRRPRRQAGRVGAASSSRSNRSTAQDPGPNNLGPISLNYGAATTYPLILAFFFSLLQANWTYTAMTRPPMLAEETVGARMSSAWGVFLSAPSAPWSAICSW